MEAIACSGENPPPMSLPSYKGPLKSINDTLASLVEAGEKLDTSVDGVVRISHRPHFGEQAYAVTLHDPVDEETIAAYERIHSIELPQPYKEFLTQLGGADIFGLCLYGIPRSMAVEPPSLEPDKLQPLDLATSNKQFRAAFASKKKEFYIGGSYWTLFQVVGYFMGGDGAVRALAEGGRCMSRWPSLRKFLADELERCRKFYATVEKTQRRLMPESTKGSS